MIIPSIDLMDGNAVQLVGGREKELDAGDPRPLATRFGRVGEVAVIDLDAALGRGDNTSVIEDLLRSAQCRVGGGIRDVDAALRWLDRGAARVILGTAARPEILRELPRERVIAALDARDGEVVVEGWTTGTGASIADRMRELRDHVGGFLVTFVEREGRLGGTDLERARELVEVAGDARITFAGGITTAEEVRILHELGADAQVGMALYTDRLPLAEAFAAPLSSDRADGLWPTVVTDEHGVALGLAYSNRESLALALEDGRGVYSSRRRGTWVKGETSGATQELLRVDADCDADALRFTVQQHGGGFCHEGTRTCWGAANGLPELARRLASRLEGAPPGSYTRRLFDDPKLLRAKLEEEAGELGEAISRFVEGGARTDVTHEAADVFYFALVALARAGVPLVDLERELDRRSLAVTRRPGDAKPRVTADWGGTLRRVRPGDVEAHANEPLPADVLTRSRRIVEDVERRGEVALREHAERLGDLEPGAPLLVSRHELERSLTELSPERRAVLERVAARVERFAQAQRQAAADVDVPVDGGRAGASLRPVARAGCYAPGGRFPLPSSVLMTAITARAAGVPEVLVASPRPSVETRAAAALAGADGLLAVGGAQAIAAFAYGAGVVPRCDVIVGPGNRYVTAAKQLVSGVVGIDMLAGPSELLVLADDTADPGWIAADLLAQAEHDVDARPILVSTSSALVGRVESELVRQLATLPTAETAAAALHSGFAVVCADLDEAVAVCNRLAPEHLEVQLADTTGISSQLANQGALFLGSLAGEVLGDYGAGPNHVLPTGGAARFASALSVLDFLRVGTWLEVTDATQARPMIEDAVALARMEGLEAHARSAERRLP